MAHKLKSWLAGLPCTCVHGRNLSAYMDGELDARVRARLEKHLAGCGSCRAQYERMRFASRAVSHLTVPQVRPPAWQAVAAPRPFGRSSEARTRLESFWTMKINVPVPVAAAAALALLFCLAGLLALGQLNLATRSIEPLATNALAPQVKFVEVPVERERIITRTVYVERASRSTSRTQAPLTVARREQRNVSHNGELLTSTSLAGFRPATDARLRIVKEPER